MTRKWIYIAAIAAPLAYFVAKDYLEEKSRVNDAFQGVIEPSFNESLDQPEHIQQEPELRDLYPNFRFPRELETIIYHADRVGADRSLLLAIREAENGGEGRQFGIMPTRRYTQDRGYTVDGQFFEYPDDMSKQASWAAWTVRSNLERYNSLDARERETYSDFIDFLGDRYAPTGSAQANRNWEPNVRSRYRVHSGG